MTFPQKPKKWRQIAQNRWGFKRCIMLCIVVKWFRVIGLSIKVGKTTLIMLTEAEKQFGVSRMTLLRAVKRGELEGIQIARRTFVKPEQVAKWVATKYRRDMAERAKKRWQRKKPKTEGLKGN